jgi:hypothetical protein
MNLPKNYTIPAGYISVVAMAERWGTTHQAVRGYIRKGAPCLRGEPLKNGQVPYYIEPKQFQAWVNAYKAKARPTGRPRKIIK